MSGRQLAMLRTAFVVAILALAACTSNPQPAPRELPIPEIVKLKAAENVENSRPPLNISISVFQSEREVSGSLYSSAAQVRSVEQRYLPFLLKETLTRSGHWGAVRVMPRDDPSAEINVSGTILFSDGVELKLAIRVQDARGKVWFEQVYYDVASELDYAVDPNYQIDPFQDIYNKIANDMSDVLLLINDDTHRQILEVASVRYGMALSPEAFSKYLNSEEGLFVLVGLPSLDDPVFERVQRIRDSEYLFTDGVDAHYESLHRKLGPTYSWWRYFSYELIVGNQRLKTIDATRGATRGSWYAMERIYKTHKESKMNEDALRELTASFDRETAPIVTEIAGRVVELDGTLDTQYTQWRRLLRQLYLNETEL